MLDPDGEAVLDGVGTDVLGFDAAKLAELLPPHGFFQLAQLGQLGVGIFGADQAVVPQLGVLQPGAERNAVQMTSVATQLEREKKIRMAEILIGDRDRRPRSAWCRADRSEMCSSAIPAVAE